MKTIYLNWRGQQGLETVDELRRTDSQTPRDFRAEVRRLIEEYRTAGMAVYPSQRACRGWESK